MRSKRSQALLRGRVSVLSPHLDDAAYSLGAAIREGVLSGAEVSVITVFAGDPNSSEEASPWDRRFGFRSAGEAASARREEDGRACAILGASPVWLPFDDRHGRPVEDDELWHSVERALDRAETVLIPGYPLDHEDHLRLAQLALSRPLTAERVGLYAEQPYAAVRGREPRVPSALVPLVPLVPLVASEPMWRPLGARIGARLRKVRAWRAYRSQFGHFGNRSLVNVLRYEARQGGEMTTLQ